LANLFKNSLERLCVHEICSSFMQLPHMPKLGRLEFLIYRDFDSKFVDLNKLFPALKELELDGWDFLGDFEWEEFLPNSAPCPNVNSLSVARIVRFQLFDHILNIFPKLTKLEVEVKTDGVQILRKIMIELTQLEDLSLDGTLEGIQNIDAILSGIPVQKVQELEYVVTELKEMSVQLRQDTIRHYRTQHCQFPSIANLTNLKRLQLGTIGRSHDGEGEPPKNTRMTDVFAFFCLYSMKHINKLEIGDCEFTTTACKILTAEMGLDTWIFTDSNFYDIIPKVK